MLHGGGLSWWNYKLVLNYLDDYQVYMPILDGHGKNPIEFTTIRAQALRLIDYIDRQLNGCVDLICGLSLGAQVVLELLAIRPSIAHAVVIESASVMPSPIAAKTIKPIVKISYPLIAKPWFAKLQFKSLKLPQDLWDAYMDDSTTISLDSLQNMLYENQVYTLSSNIHLVTARALIIAGGRENKNIVKSAQLMHKSIENSELKVVDGWYHGYASMHYPEKYIQWISALLN